VEAAYKALDVPWGDVFRLRSNNVDLAANGGPGSLGIFGFSISLRRQMSDFSFRWRFYVAAIEFSNPVKAMALTSYGNATQPGSPHIGEQLQMFARKQLRPVWRSRQDIVAHLEKREVF
jgi:acyl-homoserine-lactone acylase